VAARLETNELHAGSREGERERERERERGREKGSKEILIKPFRARVFVRICVRVGGRVSTRVCAHASSSAVNYTYGFHYRTSLLWNRKPRYPSPSLSPSLPLSLSLSLSPSLCPPPMLLPSYEKSISSNSGDYQASFSDGRQFCEERACKLRRNAVSFFFFVKFCAGIDKR
jgi:hypothetical protein